MLQISFVGRHYATEHENVGITCGKPLFIHKNHPNEHIVDYIFLTFRISLARVSNSAQGNKPQPLNIWHISDSVRQTKLSFRVIFFIGWGSVLLSVGESRIAELLMVCGAPWILMAIL